MISRSGVSEVIPITARLAAGLEAEPEGLAGVADLLDDPALLVHLDREDALVVAPVAVLDDRATERVGDVDQALAQEVAEVDEQRRAEAALAHARDHLVQVDLDARVARRTNHHVTGGIDVEEPLAPVADRVERRGFLDAPARFGGGARRLGARCGSGGCRFGQGVCHQGIGHRRKVPNRG
jgi:hypothetical protein